MDASIVLKHMGFSGPVFSLGFVALWVPLGSLLGPLEVSWEASGPKNMKKHRVF